MKSSRSVLVPTLLVSTALMIGLTGCSASVHSTSVDAVPTSQISKEATKIIQNSIGPAPVITITCGSGSTELVNNKKLDCTLNDPTDKLTYATTVKLGKVKGYSYTEYVDVAKKPNN
jgi:hypothetical protein